MFAATIHSQSLLPKAGAMPLGQSQEVGQRVTAPPLYGPPSVAAASTSSPRALVAANTGATASLAPAVSDYTQADSARDDADAFTLALALEPSFEAVADEAIADELPAAFAEAQKFSLAAEHLDLLRHGDGAAWDEFVTNWSPRLFSYLRYSLPTREDAEDALSETLVATVEAIKHFDGKSQVSTWLYSIARRKVADFWRKSSNTEELSDLFQAAPNGFSLEFREALAALPKQARQALLLRYREGFSVSEVSEIMGRTYKATESLLSRGRTLLARQLQPEPEAE